MNNLYLTKEEEEFVAKHAIDAYEIFNADGMKTKDWKEAIQGQDYMLIANTSPCRDYGHRLRTRAGHCAICNPRNLGFQKRYYDSGELYIAYSEESRLVKVGVSSNSNQRINSLNSQNYADVTDWILFYSEKLESGVFLIETDIHKLLSQFQVNVLFSRSCNIIEQSREVFSCDPNTALNSLKDTINSHKIKMERFIEKISRN